MDDQSIIANDPDFGNVSICPGGVVHVNLPHISLKFVPSDFIRFAELIRQAHQKYAEPNPRPKGKPSLQLVSANSDDQDEPDSEE